MVWPVSDCDVKSLGEIAVFSAVAISKVTPLAPAGAERLTVKVKVVVPELPSFMETSLTVRLGSELEHGPSGDDVLPGAGAPAIKSEALLSVSVHPLPARSVAVVLESVAAPPLPSKQLAVAP